MRYLLLFSVALAACAGGHQDPCTDFTCPAPAAPTCDGNTLVAQQAGVCSDDNGTPSCAYGDQRTDCTANNQVCMDGACIDPCASMQCTTPPSPTCSSDGKLTTYATPGTCTAPGGVPSCAYSPVTTDCAASDQACDDTAGACADPCATNPCTTPPADTCTNDTLNQHPNPGTCTSPGGVVACDYTPTPVDCTATDQICSGGACADPCIGFTCDTPPTDFCTNNTLTSYPASGTCHSPAGVPGCDYPPTTQDCTMIDRVCQGGACVDPCIGVTCNTPPAATCTGAGNLVARTFASSGTCSSPQGVTECDYAPTDKDCSLSGQGCNAGACTGPILFVRVQSPDSIVDVPTTTKTVYGRIYVQGVTDQSGVNDPNPNVKVEFGLGTGNDPTTFTYTAATPNAAYGPASPGYEANNDEWMSTFVVPASAGTVEHYAFRLSNDGGTTWIYGDTGSAGSSDGFTLPGVLDIAAPYLSEYIEGSANASNKAVEIYNPGSIPFTMTSCELDVYANGNTSFTKTTITNGTIVAGGVYTICKTGITDNTHCNQSTGSGLWNGNDAVVLKCGTTTYDVIGQIGNDPGAGGWGTGLTSTADHTLLRKCTVFAGDTDGSNAFDPAAEWAGYAADTLTYLGARNCPLP